MTAQSIDTYHNHPTYKLAMKHFQSGDWDPSLAAVEWLMKQFPLEHELRSLRKEIQLRLKLNDDEKTDNAINNRKRIMSYTFRLVGALILAIIVFISIRTLSTVLNDELELARSTILREVLLIEQTAKFRDAQAFLQADRPDDALVLLQEITENGADFPGLNDALLEARSSSDLKEIYEEANYLLGVQDWDGARSLLMEISETAPNYRNVANLLAGLDSFSYLSELYKQASDYYEAEEWVEALSGFEGVRALDPNFESDGIEDRLYKSYVHAAQSILIDQEDSLVALNTAEKYFRKALALRPQNPEIKSQRELARYYIDAQANFLAGQWTDVIAALEVVYAKDSTYASGVALQTLYEAYVARGDSQLAAGDYETALTDFQRAVILAEQDSEAVLRLYEAQLKAAEAHGAQDNYEAAVLLYRSAVEISRLRVRAQQEDLVQLALLDEAELYAAQGNFSVSYESYRKALGITQGNYCMSFEPYQEAMFYNSARQSMKQHIVEADEYLTMIANRYRSTVCAIVLANNISDPNTIFQGQELLIPVLQ